MAKIKEVDVLVIGGGVNGCGIARDLAGRGLSVMLVEKDDLASATSSASTKLIHGGLRYLEHYEFRLVREALAEREVLLKAAPHIIWPLTFILPHHRKLRPWWMIRLGLFLYDNLGGRKLLAKSRGRFLTGTLAGAPLKADFRRGFSYSDCWVEDTRLVVLNARDAADKGAEIWTRTECTGLAKHDSENLWKISLHDWHTDEDFTVHAKMVVNASGPWVGKTLKLGGSHAEKYKVRWVKGSHIIVPRLYQGDHAYILQNDDKRIVFAIPYERKYTLIGTTDVDYTGDIEEVRISLEEVEYLCTAVNHFFRQPVKPEDVQWTYSGVRPLADDGQSDASSVTRDYILDMEEHDGLPILSVYGGKLTTSRKLSEHAAQLVTAKMGLETKDWTETAFLPGADAGTLAFDNFVKQLRREYAWLPEALALRYARAYGVRVRDLVRHAKRLTDLGEHAGENVYEAELRYLVHNEWAMTLEDVLWRRSKLGLHTTAETQARMGDMLEKIQAQQEAA
ncbi:MAG: glycerol-3-phosphate dehydrogenase [Micavibrio sp.]|nr:glycerol-3-phosphate dehydrogenase [Micavibrio sp.]